MKGLIHKYFYKFPIEKNAPGELSSDTNHIYTQLRQLFNSYAKEEIKHTAEVEVMKDVAADIAKEIAEAENNNAAP